MTKIQGCKVFMEIHSYVKLPYSGIPYPLEISKKCYDVKHSFYHNGILLLQAHSVFHRGFLGSILSLEQSFSSEHFIPFSIGLYSSTWRPSCLSMPQWRMLSAYFYTYVASLSIRWLTYKRKKKCLCVCVCVRVCVFLCLWVGGCICVLVSMWLSKWLSHYKVMSTMSSSLSSSSSSYSSK